MPEYHFRITRPHFSVNLKYLLLENEFCKKLNDLGFSDVWEDVFTDDFKHGIFQIGDIKFVPNPTISPVFVTENGSCILQQLGQQILTIFSSPYVCDIKVLTDDSILYLYLYLIYLFFTTIFAYIFRHI